MLLISGFERIFHITPNNNNNDTPNNNNDLPNRDQPIHAVNTGNKFSSSLSDVISELKKVFRIPPQMDRKATSVAVSSSAAAQRL